MEKVWKTETETTAIAEPRAPRSPGSPDPLCGMCELIFATLKSELSQDVTVEKLTSLLDEACNVLPSGLQKDCKGFVKEYTPMIAAAFNATTPETICTDLTVCPASAVSRPNDGVLCELCTLAVKAAEANLAENATEQQVINDIMKVCDIPFPDSFRNECTSLVKEEGPQIYEAIVSEDPNEVCSLLTLCNSTGKTETTALAISRPSDGQFCELCTLAVTLLEKDLAENATEQQVINDIMKVCDIPFLDSFRNDCISLVKKEGRKIYEAIINEDPNEVCSLLTLCTNGTRQTETTALAISRPNDGVLCKFCTIAVEAVEDELADNATEKQVIHAITTLCNITIFSDFQEECLSLVREEGRLIYDAIVNENPNEVCSLLSLCVDNIVATETNEMCTACEYVTRSLQAEISKNGTVEEIASMLNAACDLVSSATTRIECKAIVVTYAKQLLETFAKEDPEQACTSIGLCTGDSYLLKGSEI